jgi:hypothetical protein
MSASNDASGPAARLTALQCVSEGTVQRQWEKVRLLFYRALDTGP